MVWKATIPRQTAGTTMVTPRSKASLSRRQSAIREERPSIELVQSASDDEDDGVWQALFHGPAHEAGAFYNQIHDEIKLLRSRVDQKLKDMIVGGKEDVEDLNRQLLSLKSYASSESEQEIVPFAAEAGAGIFTEDLRKLQDTMRIEEEISRKKVEKSKPDDVSYGDLRVSSSTATEPITNLTRSTVARRLHQVNFPEPGVILEHEHESSSSSYEEDQRRREALARRNRKRNKRNPSQSPKSPGDAVTTARKITTEDAVTNARFGIESPPRRRFFADGSTFPPQDVYEERTSPELDLHDGFPEKEDENLSPISSEDGVISERSEVRLDEVYDPPLNRTASEVHRSIATQPGQRPTQKFFPPSPAMEPPASKEGDGARSRIVPDPDAIFGATPRKTNASKAGSFDKSVSMKELNEGNLDLLVASLEYLDDNIRGASQDHVDQKKNRSKRGSRSSRRSNENKLERMMSSLEYLDQSEPNYRTSTNASDQLRPLAVNNHKALSSAKASSQSSQEHHGNNSDEGSKQDPTYIVASSSGSHESDESHQSRSHHRRIRTHGRDQPEYASASEGSRSPGVSYRYEYDYKGRRVQRSFARDYHDTAEVPKEGAQSMQLRQPKQQQQQKRIMTPSTVTISNSHNRLTLPGPSVDKLPLKGDVVCGGDWLDTHSHASHHSYASRSIAIKSANLQSIAQSSVTDSMDMHSHADRVSGAGASAPTSGRDLLAELEEEVGAGVCVKIERVQNHPITDPYGDKGRYTGLLVKEKPYGHGSMHYEDGRSYTGEWKNGRWHGRGRTLFVNGDFFVGEYVKDQRHGLGRYEWTDGRVYDGQFKRDRRDGKGTYTWPDGAIYAGDFKAGQRHGQGCYKFKDGSVYTGEFREGLYHGVGECVWADGRCYRGEWNRGHAHGYGIEIRQDGSIRHEGEWRNDRPVRPRQAESEKVEKKKSMIPEGDRDRQQRRINNVRPSGVRPRGLGTGPRGFGTGPRGRYYSVSQQPSGSTLDP